MATDTKLTDEQVQDSLDQLARWHTLSPTTTEQALRNLQAKRAENVRLREALRGTITYCEQEADMCDPYCCKIYLDEIAKVAREALGETPEEET